MRLARIKLAGFKSFVDPTVFHLPSPLVAIVGPNGCGKSNIIDAVRWVMGESSARHLRGESMADVIFNGSASRKPVGQATIELTFDNSQGKLQGPWATFDEIAVKRVITRSGQSSYYLNNIRCRRRDVTQLFLGTGLGPRSYAIIEQGMISRVIDARPEDLRAFLEEAAGISKYKERRRETELRLGHTQDNLTRLEDVRGELEAQLTKLKRQAEAAERYQRLVAERQRLQGERLALEWRRHAARREELRGALLRGETQLEGLVAEQRRLETQLEAQRQTLEECRSASEAVQRQHLETGAEIARLEQSLAHRKDLAERRRKDLAQLDQDLRQVAAQLLQDRESLEEITAQHLELAPGFAAAQAAEAQAQTALVSLEADRETWQGAWEAFGQRRMERQRLADRERNQIEYRERQGLERRRRVERLRLDAEALDEAGALAGLAILDAEAQAAEADRAAHAQALATLEEQLAAERSRHGQLVQEVEGLQARLQAGRGRLASLETLQEAALGRDRPQAWLAAQGLLDRPRLAEQLRVAPGWERAAEAVLGPHLDAVCLAEDEFATAAAALAHNAPGRGALVVGDGTSAAVPAQDPVPPGASLAVAVAVPAALVPTLAAVTLVEDLTGALAQVPSLAAGASLVTRDGLWLGKGWLQCQGVDDGAGTLAREAEIRALAADLAADEAALAEGVAARDAAWEAATRGEAEGGECRRALQEAGQRAARLQAQRDAQAKALDQLKQRRQALVAELDELRELQAEDDEALAEARLRLEDALADLEALEAEGDRLSRRRDDLKADLEAARQRHEGARRQAQGQALALEALEQRRTATALAVTRLEERQTALIRRQADLEAVPVADDGAERRQLDACLARQLTLDTTRNTARQELEAADRALRAQESARGQGEKHLTALREALEAQRLQGHEAHLKAQGLAEQIEALGTSAEALLAQLPEGADEASYPAALAALEERIRKLGAINLAAIEECAQLAERKDYLDAQYADLQEALATLEGAMAQIDRETRQRFKETFEAVNRDLGTLFPRLFGGGQAHLALVGDDTLDAGVAIMAQPPGKRVGRIQQLSGGEKALTAVALVFALFQLNPAPFCMLDEVDAPLDEANVGRFGRLVQEMADRVQFIFITHNKATMEVAQHLTGVTMQEPGVSRLVAVDVDEAVQLAG
ncbi:MAG: chromosome segregation protein SMC [Candidatus Competibacterales bacterium]